MSAAANSPIFRHFGIVLALSCLVQIQGCKQKSSGGTSAAPSASGSTGPERLSPELAGKVLAKVGEREITLGEYAAAIERMDPFERLRYQSPERRRQLLDEMIDVELLATEARRRGLDKRPETEERTRQILRDELLRETRRNLPQPNDIPDPEVRAYYAKHREEFRDPERRRVAHIVMSNEAEAKKVLARAKAASPTEWGKLVQQYSLDKPPAGAAPGPLELAGDLGIVGPVGHPRGHNPRVKPELREAVFKIAKISEVYPELVKAEGLFHIVRMTGRTDARERSYEDAQRAVRVAIIQAKIREREEQLDGELRKKFKVVVDDAALAKVSVPAPGSSAPPSAPGKP